jgi:hypothetical protein
MNTTGNCIVIFLFFIVVTMVKPLAPTTISLKITDLDNNALKEAGAGQSFLLHVIAKDVQNTAQYPDIKGIENIHIRNAGFQMNMINGNTSITYQYRVRIDTPGTYTLGPAQLVNNNTLVNSEPITILVSGEQKFLDAKKSSTSTHNTSTFLKLACAQDNAFVGQKVPCTLTFYTADPNVVLESLIEPDNAQQTSYRIKNKKEPITGTQWINGVEHRYAQWQWDLYPSKPGPCTIPAYGAHYNNKSQRDMISLFFARPDQKRLYSNAVTLTIQPLPPAAHASPLIGTIISYTAHAEPYRAAVGHGIVVTLTAVGTVDFESLAIVPLANMPNQLKWYESKHMQEQSKLHDGFIKHTMEYIVQGLEQGSWHIPAQELTYFDPQQCVYKTISTESIMLTITAAASTNSATFKPNVPDATIDTMPAPLVHSHATSTFAQGLPVSLFWALVCCLSALWLGIMLWSIQLPILMPFKKRWRKARLFSHARAAITATQNNQTSAELYRTFTDLIAAISDASPTQITPEQTNQFFAQRGMPKQLQQEWHTFFSHLLEIAFYTTSSVDNHLIEQALYWITVIEKLS